MKNIHVFEIGEESIDSELAEKLRENILIKAKEQFISTNPIQYNRLLEKIKLKMADFQNIYDFKFEGSEVNFNIDNSVLFSVRVLKRLFSEGNDDKIISMQVKNLDILSFYAFDKPWREIDNKRTNRVEVINSIQEDILLSISQKKFKNYFDKEHLKKGLYIIQYIIFLIILLWLLNNYSNLQNKFVDKDNKFKILQDEYLNKDDKYQSTIKWLNELYWKDQNFDVLYYDTLSIPTSEKRIFTKFFSVDHSLLFKGNINIEIIKSNDLFKSEPELKSCDKFGGSMAFGFGRTFCPTHCYEPFDEFPYNKQHNSVILRINFKNLRFITYISFKWVELYGNWGSCGYVYINGKRIGGYPYQDIGIWPNSNMLRDETVRTFKCQISEKTKYIDIFVCDIANESEIFIDDIEIYGK